MGRCFVTILILLYDYLITVALVVNDDQIVHKDSMLNSVLYFDTFFVYD